MPGGKENGQIPIISTNQIGALPFNISDSTRNGLSTKLEPEETIRIRGPQDNEAKIREVEGLWLPLNSGSLSVRGSPFP